MEISLEKIYRIAKKKILWIIIAAIVFGVVAYVGVTYLTAPIYTISGQFYIYDTQKVDSTSSNRNYNMNAANTYVAILSASDFFQKVSNNIKENPEKYLKVYTKVEDPSQEVSVSPVAADPDASEEENEVSANVSYIEQDLPEDITITKDELIGLVYPGMISSGTSYSIITDTEVVRISFQNADKRLVYPVMAAIFDTIESQIRESYNPKVAMKPVETPKPNGIGVSTSRRRTITIIVAAVGAIAALLFFYIRDMLDIHIRGANTIVEKYQLPVLGRVPSFDPSLLTKKEAATDVKKNQ